MPLSPNTDPKVYAGGTLHYLLRKRMDLAKSSPLTHIYLFGAAIVVPQEAE